MARRTKDQLFLDAIKTVIEFDVEKLEKATLEEGHKTLTEFCTNLKTTIDQSEYLKELAALKEKYGIKD